MNSKPRVSYKFIPRNLHISDENGKIFQKVCIKRVFLKKIIDKRRRGADPDEKVYRPFKKNKLFKTLRTVQIPCIHQSYAHESLKSSKLLKSFSVDAISDNASLQKVALYIKRFPITIKSVGLKVCRDRRVPHQSFEKLAKSIRRLKNLECFKRELILESRRPHLAKELRAYSKSAERLKKLKKLVFHLSDGEQKEFQKAINKNGTYPGITTLKINLQGYSFPNYETYEPFARSEDSFDADKPSEFDNMNPLQHQLYQMILKNVIRDDTDEEDKEEENPRNPVNQNDEEDEEEDGDEENDEDQEEEEEEEIRYDDDDDSDNDNEDNNRNTRDLLGQLPLELLLGSNFGEWRIREAIRAFYRFELFPDLKKVSLRQDDFNLPLDSFVIDAFAALKKLEHLDITMHSRAKGSYNLFKGFLRLPLIKKFSLALPFIKNNDWVLLQEFVKNQKNLESFSLVIFNQTSTKARYLQQNVYFEDLIKCLEGKSLLKLLELRSEYWSLETLSKGLSHLTMANQLKSLIFEGSDDTMTSDSKPWKRVEGICNFVKNQKDSLETLGVFLPFAKEDNIVTHIAETISKLSQLKELQLSINPSGYKSTIFGRFSGDEQDFFERRKEPKNTPKVSEPWNPNVGEYLTKLENLEELWFKFDILGKNPPTWFADAMTALPSLEKLRGIRILTSSGRQLLIEEDRIISAVEQLNQIRKFDLMCYDYPEEGKLKGVVKKVNERQSLRCDLMF